MRKFLQSALSFDPFAPSTPVEQHLAVMLWYTVLLALTGLKAASSLVA